MCTLFVVESQSGVWESASFVHSFKCWQLWTTPKENDKTTPFYIVFANYGTFKVIKNELMCRSINRLNFLNWDGSFNEKPYHSDENK